MSATKTKTAARRACVACHTAEAHEMFPRCLKCHSRDHAAAYSGDVAKALHRVVEMAKELSDAADDLAAEMGDPGFKRSRFAKLHGEDDVYYFIQDLKALAWTCNSAGSCIDSGLYPLAD